jgi:hypothetical protein
MTLIETIIYAAMGCIVSLVSYSALRSSAVLAVKNTNLNRSHDDLRSAYDRLARHLLSANNVPTLVNTSGATVAAGTAAPGFTFDRNIGGPYLLGADPNAAGSIASTDNTLVVCYSSSTLARAPKPKKGEILLIPTASGTIRAIIASDPADPTAGPVASTLKVTLTFTAPLGKTINWGTNEPQAAKLVRPEAFLVMGAELRYFPSFQPLPVLTNPANYKVLTDQISTLSGEQTPFEITDFDGDKILTSTLQVRERQNAIWIKDDEANAYNTYFQLHVNLPSRLRPRTN